MITCRKLVGGILNILHVASFNGNIGDNANHNGLRANIRKILGEGILFTEIEMREFYQSWNNRDFNSSNFINLCNKNDLVIIGGGNFFELKWNYSSTGTTVNLSKTTLEKIKTPILFFGLGCDINKGVNSENVQKFDCFLNYITNSNQFMVTIRNDGSYETLENLYGYKYLNRVQKVADGAFSFKPKELSINLMDSDRRIMGINVVCDMKHIRFNKNLSYRDFINGLSDVLNRFLKKHNNYDLMFFPHIYSDVEAISDVVKMMNDRFRRSRITIAPYLSGENSENIIFGLYKKCDLILGMRFHSNICGIAQNIPTIGLSSYNKIIDLYGELNLNDRVVNVNEMGFERNLSKKIYNTLDNLTKIRDTYKYVNLVIDNINKSFLKKLDNWIKGNNHLKNRKDYNL